jgi:hypothetical protein
MTPRQIIDWAAARGLLLSVNGDNLRIEYASESIDPGILRNLTRNKCAILEELSQGEQVTRQFDCSGFHIKPELWTRRDGIAYCPRCQRYMGRIRGA